MVKRYKSEEVDTFYKETQPKCIYKKLLPCIVNGYTLRVFVCSKNDRKCSIKNCKQYGE